MELINIYETKKHRSHGRQQRHRLRDRQGTLRPGPQRHLRLQKRSQEPGSSHRDQQAKGWLGDSICVGPVTAQVDRRVRKEREVEVRPH